MVKTTDSRQIPVKCSIVSCEMQWLFLLKPTFEGGSTQTTHGNRLRNSIGGFSKHVNLPIFCAIKTRDKLSVYYKLAIEPEENLRWQFLLNCIQRVIKVVVTWFRCG